MAAQFDSEDAGRASFYETHLPRVDSSLSIDNVLTDYADGIVRGSILEFKLQINDLNATLFQAIKYLSRRRIKGKPVCANIILISLTNEIAYVFDSSDYLSHIETVYTGASSRGNIGFVAGTPNRVLDLSDPDQDEDLIQILRERKWTKTHIDENCIVGWAEEFYRIKPNASKADFIGDTEGKVKITGEIRQPSVFKDYLIPYTGKTNVKFNYLMDRLNDFLHKKDLGAFFTPEPYAKKAAELVRRAIKRVPEGNDYIILDRCAGTGNLEAQLTDEELSHCIVSTFEYYEYKVLVELLGDKVRHVIPPTEADDTFMGGMVRGSDALSKEFVDNATIKKYVDNPNCSIILFENPPYAETTSIEHQKKGAGKKSSAAWKNSFVLHEMSDAVRADPTIDGRALNDMGNAFIWSAFEYYLRQPTDSYVVFSPIKYWKAQHLIHRKLLGGFATDRHHYHALKHVCVAVLLWANEPSASRAFSLNGYDIGKDGSLQSVGKLKFSSLRSSFSSAYFDRRDFISPEPGILCELNGTERPSGKASSLSPVFDESCLGYLAVYSSGFDNPDLHSSLLISGRYDGHGFFLRRDNYIEKLPMFSASRYISYNGSWTERGRIMKSGDGARRFARDVKSKELKQWLLKNLLFCCLEYQNHMRSLTGSDGRFYRNELCLDGSNGTTLALDSLAGLVRGEKERELCRAWDAVLAEARKCKEYNPKLTYGLYQIGEELDLHHKDAQTGQTVYHYPALHGAIRTLKALVKDYYLAEIVPVLFEYEFLK